MPRILYDVNNKFKSFHCEWNILYDFLIFFTSLNYEYDNSRYYLQTEIGYKEIVLIVDKSKFFMHLSPSDILKSFWDLTTVQRNTIHELIVSQNNFNKSVAIALFIYFLLHKEEQYIHAIYSHGDLIVNSKYISFELSDKTE